MKKSIRVTFGVTLDVPEGSNIKSMQNYVREAVRGYDPADCTPEMSKCLNVKKETVAVSILQSISTYK